MAIKFVDAAAPAPVEFIAPSGEQLRAVMLENKARGAARSACVRACGGAHAGGCGAASRLRRLSGARRRPRPAAAAGGPVHHVGQDLVVRRRRAVRHVHRQGARGAVPLRRPSARMRARRLRARPVPAAAARARQVEEGAELLSECTATEQKKLKGVRARAAAAGSWVARNHRMPACAQGAAAARHVPTAAGGPPLLRRPQKPDSWRLACQTIVGDGENSGRVVVATKPQQ